MKDVTITFATARGGTVRSSDGYRGFDALSGISLDIKAGDRVGLIGKNGAGKSTLLRTMAGIYPPRKGSVEVEGQISSMFNMGLGMQMEYSGMRNIQLSNLIANVPQKDRPALTKKIAEFTELGDFLNNAVRTYSSGMGMRLRFACATTLEPDILLLDEWVGAGDAEFQAKATDRMNELVSTAGIVVLATHNIPLMRKVCTKAVWLDKGRIVKAGEMEDVLDTRTRALFPEKFVKSKDE